MRKNLYSAIAIVLILLGEVFYVIGNKLNCCFTLYGWKWDWGWIMYGLSFVSFFALIVLGIHGVKYEKFGLSIKTMVLKKLLANAIAPKRISAFYLLFFIIHLTWISDATLNLFLPHAYPCWPEILVSFGISIFGLCALIFFFPTENLKEDKNNPRVFVSGISIPSAPPEYESLNLLPLVRVLKFKDQNNSADNQNMKNIFLILRTDKLLVEKDVNIDLTNLRELLSWERLYNVWTFLKKCDIISNANAKQEDVDSIDKTFKIVKEINDSRKGLSGDDKEAKETEIKHHIIDFINNDGNQVNLDKILKYIIRILVKTEFSEDGYVSEPTLNVDEEIENLKIVLTDGCDYNNFKSCQKVLQESLRSYKDDEYNIIFNITPGTSIVGALMMLFGVDPMKKACFYAQDGSKKIIKIDKDYSVFNKIFKEVLAKTEEDNKSQ